jgi:WD40 repeat protein
MHHGADAVAIEFSPDGKFLMTYSKGQTTSPDQRTDDALNSVRVWEVATGRLTHSLRHNGSVSRAAFAVDGKRIATVSWDGTARVWDAVTGEDLVRIVHNGPVTTLALSPNGDSAATATFDSRDVHLWALESGVLVHEACKRLRRNLTRLEWERYLPGLPYGLTCPSLSKSN